MSLDEIPCSTICNVNLSVNLLLLNFTDCNITLFYREYTKILLDFFKETRAQGFHKLEYLNIGGGLGIDYRRHVSEILTSQYLS